MKNEFFLLLLDEQYFK